MGFINALCASSGIPMIADIIVGIFIFVMVLICAKKGFINCFFKFISTIIALVIAFAFAKTFVSITGGLFGIQETFQSNFLDTFASLPGFDIDVSTNISGNDLGAVQELLAEHNISAIVAKFILKNYTNATIPAGTTLAMMAADSTANLGATLVAGAVLFVLVKLLLLILRKMLTFIAKRFKLMKLANSLLGAFVGLFEALTTLSLLISLLSLSSSPQLISFMENSLILDWIANNNPITLLLSLFI